MKISDWLKTYFMPRNRIFSEDFKKMRAFEAKNPSKLRPYFYTIDSNSVRIDR